MIDFELAEPMETKTQEVFFSSLKKVLKENAVLVKSYGDAKNLKLKK